jgi:hypothetical protein
LTSFQIWSLLSLLHCSQWQLSFLVLYFYFTAVDWSFKNVGHIRPSAHSAPTGVPHFLGVKAKVLTRTCKSIQALPPGPSTSLPYLLVFSFPSFCSSTSHAGHLAFSTHLALLTWDSVVGVLHGLVFSYQNGFLPPSNFTLLSPSFLKTALPAGHRWYTPVTLATQEDCGSKPAPGKWFVRPHLEKKLITKKGWRSDSSGKRTCLANVKP